MRCSIAAILCQASPGRAPTRGVELAIAFFSGVVNRLGPSHSTVKHHLANARSKLGATTTAQLVWILAPRLPEPEGLARTDE